jgi:DNA-binding beta-propeller fold protein YncE
MLAWWRQMRHDCTRAHFVSGTVTEIDIVTARVPRTLVIGGVPQGLALCMKGTRLFVVNEEGNRHGIVLAMGAARAPIPVAGPAFGIGVTPDSHEARIAIPSTGQVQVFNLQGRRLHGALDVGGEPHRIALSALGKIGAVTDLSGKVIFVR